MHHVPVKRSASYPTALLGAVLVLLGWSAIGPHDRFTWFLEVAPVLIGAPILLGTYSRFPLTPLVYMFLALIGATTAQLLLGRLHDRQLARLLG